MKQVIDFTESLKDSPSFRNSLEEVHSDLEVLETKLTQIVKSVDDMFNKGQTYLSANVKLILGLEDLSNYFRNDFEIKNVLGKTVECLRDVMQFHNTLLDQARRSIRENLNTFIHKDIKQLKERRREFQKVSTDFDSALYRTSIAPKYKISDCKEADECLAHVKTTFSHVAFDYVCQTNDIMCKRRFEILDTMRSFLNAQNTYFHQGYEYFTKECDCFMKTLTEKINIINANMKKEEEKTKSMQKDLITEDRILSQFPVQLRKSENDSILQEEQIEGYLWRRTTTKIKPWVRRWFVASENSVKYCKRENLDDWTTLEPDLRVCKVRLISDNEKRFCFELMSPRKVHLLQADSELDCTRWICVLQKFISQALTCQINRESQLTSQNSPKSSPQRNLEEFLSTTNTGKHESNSKVLQLLPGNDKCCDCGAHQPQWASINLGITLCIKCSGVHRSLGVYTSKIRAVHLDVWDKTLLRVMAKLGNSIVNQIYEAEVDENVIKAVPESNSIERETWIKSKYVSKSYVKKLQNSDEVLRSGKRRWIVKKRKASRLDDISTSSESSLLVIGADLAPTPPDNDAFGDDNSSETELDDQSVEIEDIDAFNPNVLLYRAAEARQPKVILEALAMGAEINFKYEEREGKTSLMAAVEVGSQVATELLLLNNANIDLKDSRGRTALHHAVLNNRKGNASQLIKRKANFRSVDEDGKDPLQIALQNESADIVALLRMAQMREEMSDDDDSSMLTQAINEFTENDADAP
ncbi:DgyrCDS8184 [Dimorphilus gyrociliatus]|uniref:DgyrCDS8184 n=1 Tax=Dimorphilus gyrociliatus TaxID=2664684 RepID=A0A7I8VV13_9ANNE|nr:DgyrCDS8184 [Dimorphilus gyrociliatus]